MASSNEDEFVPETEEEEAEQQAAGSETAAATAEEPERRLIDGNWLCEDGAGGFLVYEDEQWKPFEGEDLREKWDAAAETVAPQRCVVDGVTMEWNEAGKQWLPVVEVNEDFLAVYNANYGIEYDFEHSEGTSASTAKEEEQKTEEVPAKKAKGAKEKDNDKNQGWVEMDEEKIASVYVSNLPKTITEEEFVELMSKCGVIQRDPRTNKMKIKMYKDDEGGLKGDATCGYIKKESVDLALKILDGWDINGTIIKVEKAKFQMKGDFDPKKKKKKLTAAQKKRFVENQQRIFDWKPEKPRNYRPVTDCTIIMKNMFTLDQMMSNAALVLDLEEEMRKVCERFGKVKKVVVYDNNPEGVISVGFENVEQSETAVRSLNKRVVDGRTIDVSIWDGKTKYTIKETEEQKQERLAQWRKHIGEE